MGDERRVDPKIAQKLTILPLIALIFYDVSGGPFGVEDSVSTGGGPLLALLGFLVFPFIWSIPEALITAELATSFLKMAGMWSGFRRHLALFGVFKRGFGNGSVG